MTIAIFYFACWTPYWFSVLYVSYVDIFESRAIKTLSNKSEDTLFLLYCAHTFPYVNTALNWLLYSRLARNLRGNSQSQSPDVQTREETKVATPNSRVESCEGKGFSRIKPGVVPLESSADMIKLLDVTIKSDGYNSQTKLHDLLF